MECVMLGGLETSKAGDTERELYCGNGRIAFLI